MSEIELAFAPDMWQLVWDGLKHMTICRETNARPGDRLWLRAATPCIAPPPLCQRTCRAVVPVQIGFIAPTVKPFVGNDAPGCRLDGHLLSSACWDEFARLDGFRDSAAMFRWLTDRYELFNRVERPFSGVAIYWE